VLTTKNDSFFIFKIHQGGREGGYFKGILLTSTKSTLHYYKLNETFVFYLGVDEERVSCLDAVHTLGHPEIHVFSQTFLTFL